MTTRIAALTVAIMIVAFGTPAVRAVSPAFDDVLAVPFFWSPGGHRSAMGDFMVLNDGTVMMAYTDQTDTFISAEQRRIAAVFSTDQGKTWGNSTTLIDPPGGGAGAPYICHPSLLRAANGDILLSYVRANFAASPYQSGNLIRRSSDEGQTWSAPTIQSTAPGYPSLPYEGVAHIHNDRMQTLSNGRIIAMAETKKYFPSTRDHEGYVGQAYYSDDQGYTWYPGAGHLDMYPVEVQEADFVELTDGRLMMFARSYSGHPVRAYSNDSGNTWYGGQLMTELSMPYAGFTTVRRIPSTGDLLFLWPDESGVNGGGLAIRTSIACAISQDEGQTFIHHQQIVANPQQDFGYQCLEFLDDGTALLGYHTNDGLHVASIPTGWFYETVPEPGTLTLMLCGIATAAFYGWRKKDTSR